MEEPNFIWQDREIRFDVPKIDLKLRKGEESLDTITNIEDSKSPCGDIGTFVFTNLRLIWYCNTNIGLNFSIGYDCISDFKEQAFTSKITGETTALSIKCRSKGNIYGLLFNSVSDSGPSLLSALQSLVKIYEASRLYRDIKVKGSITKDKKLTLLPDENITGSFNPVCFVSQNQKDKTNGQLLIGNIRLVWFANSVDNYNVSIPWIQMKTVLSQKDPKYGKVLVVETCSFFGGAKYYFVCTDNDQFEKMLDDITKALFYYRECPVIGIDIKKYFDMDETKKNKEKTKNVTETNKETMKTFNKMIEQKKEDEEEIIDQNYFNEISNAVAYQIGNNRNKDVAIGDIVFSNELGCAVEKLPEGVTIDHLWKIIN